MKSGYWVIRTYTSGNVGEKIKYYIQGDKPRSKRVYKSEIRKQEQNDRSSERTLARILNANFSSGDVLIGLDYSDKGLTLLAEKSSRKFAPKKTRAHTHTREEYMRTLREVADYELRLLLRRVKRICEKKRIVLKYIAITSDMDGKTGEDARIHHHLIVNREAAELFRGKWNMGGIYLEPLRVQEDYTDIAHYFMEQVRHIPDAKKYMSSRNLIRPQPRDRIVISGAEPRVPKGCKLLYRSEYNEHKPQYLRYYIDRGEENIIDSST